MSDARVRVDVWADIICPWCGLGERRLEIALDRFDHRDQVDVVHHSFELDPTSPVGTSSRVADMLQARYGADDAQVREMTGRVEALAHEAGLDPYHVLDNRVGNTGPAHELLALATAEGRHAQAWSSMFAAYFGQARDVFTVDALTELGSTWGLDAGMVRTALTEGTYREKVRSDEQAAADLGVRGVPFFVLGGRYGMSGAQPVETLRSGLERVWRETSSGS